MILALSTAKKLDWSGWAIGVWGALISGGAGAVSGAFGTMIMDPDHWNLGGGLKHVIELMGICFVSSGLISLAKFLQTHPVPEPLTINTPGPVVVNQSETGSKVTAP